MARETAGSTGRLDITVELPNGARLEPRDIGLIEILRSCRSILGASRLVGLSYRKTWLMVDALNRAFETRVIDTFPGRRGGGAEVTVFGERLVALYRSIERRSQQGAAVALGELSAACDPGFAGTARSEVPAAEVPPAHTG